MSPIRITARRTMGLARNSAMTAVVVGLFLAAVAAIFAFNLDAFEGGRLSSAVAWALSVAPVLPVLAAFLGMDAWSEECRTGRIDVMLTLPVPEIDYVAGKFLGVWTILMMSVALSMVTSMVLLHLFAPACAVTFLSFLAGFAALALQGLLWSAVSLCMSAVFRRSAVAACATVALTLALPYGLWSGLMLWSAVGRLEFGEMPLCAHVVDFASGIIPCGTVVAYAALTALALFVAVLFVERRRWIGVGAQRARRLTGIAALLSVVLAGEIVFLSARIDATLDLTLDGSSSCSDRTMGILSEAQGDVAVTCFLSREDVQFRSVAKMVRRLTRAASSVGGVRISAHFVDPSWDVGEASRLVRSGVAPGSVVFSYGRRRTVLSVSEGVSERLCASTLLRLTMPPQRRNVRWTYGHGESSFEDYGPYGMSDVARELSRDGYLNQSIDLSGDTPIPSDCALILVAGAREDFSRGELSRLDAYLRQGGRLLVLMNSGESGGVMSLLPGWGVNQTALTGEIRTVSGSDAVISTFASHPVTSSFSNSRIVLERPIAFSPSAAVEALRTVEHITFTPLAQSGSDVVAALVERGADVGDDLDFRPTRIIVVGDATFALNAQLSAQAHANRDFVLNAVAYLSGTDAMTSSDEDGDLLTTGMDRIQRRRFVLSGVVGVPVFVWIFLSLVTFGRRRRG